MQQVALHQFPTVDVKYEFKCRNGANWTTEIINEIEKEVESYCKLSYSKDELDYLAGIRFFKKDFIDFLSLYKPNCNHVTVDYTEDNELAITIEGPWYLTIPFEVPVLAIVSEVYFKHQEIPDFNMNSSAANLADKKIVAGLQKFPFADFGTRRRFSKFWHREVVKELSSLKNFTGTSNVALAKEFNLRPIGTMAHEFIMVGQGREDVPLRNSQKVMLQSWVDEYRGDLGIALTDTVGIDAFLNDFDLYFAKLYDGLRHDSGDPIEWGHKVLNHYEKLGIDAKTKTLVFSDGIDMISATNIYNAFRGRAKVSFGIGTNLTNDIDGVTPLQNVMKIVEVNGRPVAKISDSPGKGMCNDDQFLGYLRKVFGINKE